VDKGVPIQLGQVIHNEGSQVMEAPFYQVFSILAGVLIYIIGYCVPTLNLRRGQAAFLTTLTELILFYSILSQIHLVKGSK
jgi:drug/metabolite transporter (DMT)-like permease